MSFHNGSTNSEAKTSPPHLLDIKAGCSVEGIEYPGQLCLGDALTFVGDTYLDIVILNLTTDIDLTTLRRVFEGIVQQVV
jgi:hypothetical protein